MCLYIYVFICLTEVRGWRLQTHVSLWWGPSSTFTEENILEVSTSDIQYRFKSCTLYECSSLFRVKVTFKITVSGRLCILYNPGSMYPAFHMPIFKKDFFYSYLKVRVTERRDREREIFCLLKHSANDCNGPSWATEARSQGFLPCLPCRYRTQGLEPFSSVFPGMLAGS